MAFNGSAQLRAISLHCQALGDRGLLNRTRGVLRAEAKPLIDAAQRAAREELPKSGGLNEYVAAQRWTVQALAGARSAGVRLKTKTPATEQTDSGIVRHPTFGRRGKGEWKTTKTRAGWATDTVKSHGPVLAAAIGRQLDAAAAEVARAAGGS